MAREQRCDFAEIRLDRIDRGLRTGRVQPVHQLMQRVKAARCAHELAVQPCEPAAAHARVRILEHGHAARGLEADHVGDEARVDRLDMRAVELARQRRRDVVDEAAEALAHRRAHLLAGVLRKHERADDAGRHDPDDDFGNARHRAHEGAVRVLRRGQADQRGRIAGEQEAVAAEVAVARGAGGAQRDPDGDRQQEQLRLLREQPTNVSVAMSPKIVPATR